LIKQKKNKEKKVLDFLLSVHGRQIKKNEKKRNPVSAKDINFVLDIKPDWFSSSKWRRLNYVELIKHSNNNSRPRKKSFIQGIEIERSEVFQPFVSHFFSKVVALNLTRMLKLISYVVDMWWIRLTVCALKEPHPQTRLLSRTQWPHQLSQANPSELN